MPRYRLHRLKQSYFSIYSDDIYCRFSRFCFWLHNRYVRIKIAKTIKGQATEISSPIFA